MTILLIWFFYSPVFFPAGPYSSSDQLPGAGKLRCLASCSRCEKGKNVQNCQCHARSFSSVWFDRRTINLFVFATLPPCLFAFFFHFRFDFAIFALQFFFHIVFRFVVTIFFYDKKRNTLLIYINAGQAHANMMHTDHRSPPLTFTEQQVIALTGKHIFLSFGDRYPIIHSYCEVFPIRGVVTDVCESWRFILFQAVTSMIFKWELFKSLLFFALRPFLRSSAFFRFEHFKEQVFLLFRAIKEETYDSI